MLFYTCTILQMSLAYRWPPGDASRDLPKRLLLRQSGLT